MRRNTGQARQLSSGHSTRRGPGGLNDAVLCRAVDVQTAWVLPGLVQIKVHQDGFAPQTVERQLNAGEKVTFDVKLLVDSRPVSNSESLSLAGSSSQVSGLSKSAREPSPPSERQWQAYIGWGAVGLGALSLGCGVISAAGTLGSSFGVLCAGQF